MFAKFPGHAGFDGGYIADMDIGGFFWGFYAGKWPGFFWAYGELNLGVGQARMCPAAGQPNSERRIQPSFRTECDPGSRHTHETRWLNGDEYVHQQPLSRHRGCAPGEPFADAYLSIGIRGVVSASTEVSVVDLD